MGDLSRQRVAALAAVQAWQADLEHGRRRLTPQLADAIRVEQERAEQLEAELQREDPQPENMAGGPLMPG